MGMAAGGEAGGIGVAGGPGGRSGVAAEGTAAGGADDETGAGADATGAAGIATGGVTGAATGMAAGVGKSGEGWNCGDLDSAGFAPPFAAASCDAGAAGIGGRMTGTVDFEGAPEGLETTGAPPGAPFADDSPFAASSFRSTPFEP